MAERDHDPSVAGNPSTDTQPETAWFDALFAQHRGSNPPRTRIVPGGVTFHSIYRGSRGSYWLAGEAGHTSVVHVGRNYTVFVDGKALVTGTRTKRFRNKDRALAAAAAKLLEAAGLPLRRLTLPLETRESSPMKSRADPTMTYPVADELKRRKMEMFGLQDEAELLAFEAVGDILHRQWLYESVAPGYGDRRMAVRHLGDVIRRAMNEAADKALNQ